MLPARHRAFRYIVLPLAFVACQRSSPKKNQHETFIQDGFSLVATRPEEALTKFARVKNPRDPRVLLGQALAHEQNVDWAGAEKSYRMLLEVSPDHPLAKTALARVLILQRRPGDAWPLLISVSKSDPAQLQAALLEAVIARTPEQIAVALSSLEEFPNAKGKAERAKAQKDRTQKDKAQQAQGQQTPDQSPAGSAPSVPAEYYAALEATLARAGRSGDAARARAARVAAKLADQKAAVVLFRLARFAGQDALALTLAQLLVVRTLDDETFLSIADLALDHRENRLARDALARLPAISREPTVLLLRGREQLQSRAYGDATRLLTDARSLVDPSKQPDLCAQIELTLAEALVRFDRPESAQNVLRALLKRRPNELEARLGLAQIALDAREKATAVALLKAPISGQAEPALVIRLGVGQLAAGLPSNAEATFRTLEDHQPRIAGLTQLLAQALLDRGKSAEAKSLLAQAAEEHPSDFALLTDLTLFYFRRGRPELALEQVETAVRAEPDNLDLQLLLAEIYGKLNHREQLAALFARLKASSPTDPKAWLALARHAEATGHLEEARDDQKRAVEQLPDANLERRRLADLLRRTNQPKEAMKTYEEVIQRDPKDLIALNNLAMLYLGPPARPDQAVELARAAHRLAPFDAAISDTLGWALVLQGRAQDLPEAVLLLSQASNATKDPDIRLHYAEALTKSGRGREAEALLRSLSQDPHFSDKARARALLAEATEKARTAPSQ